MKFPFAFFVTAVVSFGIDRFSKRWAERALSDGSTIEIWKDVFRFRLIHNEGVAFSAPVTGWPLKILTVALVAYVAYYYLREEKFRGIPLVDVAYAAFLAGAVGNGFDRVLWGKVTDFADLKYFAVFNAADMMITVSAASIVAFHILHERRRKRT